MKKIIPFILILSFLSCSQDDYENSELNNTEFEPYFDFFIEEGIIRGQDYTNYNINFYLADIDFNNAVGLCYQQYERIIIDREYWNNANEKDKEWLVFHELGHCLLNRSHRNEKSNSGDCLSLMKGRENSFDCSENLFSSLWRKYYIDELFNQDTILPNWYTNNQEYSINYDNPLEIVSITNLNTESYNSTFDFNNTEKFVIEFNFKDWEITSNNLTSVLADIYFGGYSFGSAPLSERGRLHIRNNNGEEYYENIEYNFNNNIKLTIRKNNELLQFFIDEQFIHAMEIESFDTNLLKASFETAINIDIEIFEYN
ncbi:MAG: putative metallopeptidase [Flavobacteriaceae bacterium]